MTAETRGFEQLAQGCYPIAPRPGIELTTPESQVERPNHYATETQPIAYNIMHLYSHKVLSKQNKKTNKQEERNVIGRIRSMNAH